MPLHVLQLGPVPPPEGGITRNIAAIRRLLSEKGSSSTVIATSRSESVREEHEVHHPRTIREFLSKLRTVDCDILHLHLGGDITRRLLSMALACTLLGNGKKVLTIHSGGYALSNSAKAAKRRSFPGFVFRCFSKVIAVNKELAEVFQRFGVDEANIETILPFSLEEASPDVILPREVEAFCTTHKPLLVSVGGMEKDYEPILQIEAFERVRLRHPAAGLLIVGGGSMMDMVKDHLRSLPVAGAVFIAGGVDHDVAMRLIKKADVMMRITRFDGDAISVREALFLGTPVVATDNGMRPPGVSVVAIGDQEAIVAGINDALQRPPHQKLSEPQKPDNTHIEKVIDLYEKLTS